LGQASRENSGDFAIEAAIILSASAGNPSRWSNSEQIRRGLAAAGEALMNFDFQKARNSLHQLNNKVAQILAYAELMQFSLTGEKEKERIKLVISGALECRQITASLMNDMPKTTPPGES
jgi:hypothetical protein